MTREILEEEYSKNQLTITQIAEKYKLSYNKVRSLLKKFNIPIRKVGKDTNDIKIGFICNRLTVINDLNKSNRLGKIYLCKCVCGQTKEIPASKLRKFTVKSCGACKATKATWKLGFRNKNWKGCGEISGSYWSKLQICAKKRKLDFSITIEYAWEIFQKQKGKCALSGIDIYFPTNQKDYNNGDITASLDRIDNNKGYVEGNIQWLHKHINVMKLNHNEKYFIELCKKVTKHGGKTEFE